MTRPKLEMRMSSVTFLRQKVVWYHRHAGTWHSFGLYRPIHYN